MSQLHKSSVLRLPLCSKSKQFHISTPVAKVAIVFLSYTTLLVMNSISFTSALVNYAEILESITNYSRCLAIGSRPDQQFKATCDVHREKLENLSDPAFTLISITMLGLLPYFGIIYIVRIRSIIEYIMQPCKHNTIAEQTPNTQNINL